MTSNVLPAGNEPVSPARERRRCTWLALNDPLYVRYHDTEWGVPERNDRALFELLVLEGFQAGLSWRTVLHKRAQFRLAFAGFEPAEVAGFTDSRVEQLLADPGIIRNRLKISAAISNAQRYLELQEHYGSFSAYLWSFVGGEPQVNHWGDLAEVPARTSLSGEVSAALRARGFKFLGPTTTYAYLQAAGLVQDHLTTCYRHAELS